jgi:hypothetical protein
VTRDMAPPEDGPRKAAQKKGHWKAATTALSAGFAFVFLAELLVLPPIANQQLASALEMLRKPAAAAIATAAIAAIVVWQRRWPLILGVAFVLLTLVAAAAPITYYKVTTSAARGVLAESAGWPAQRLTDVPRGSLHNSQNALGRARITWNGSDFDLALRSETGTTQQGLYWQAGATSSHYVFRARITDTTGGTVVTCPLIFGIINSRRYDTFRLQSDGHGSIIATAYIIRPNGAPLLSGFHGYLVDDTDPLPYVDTWNLLTPSESTQSTLMIDADGNHYRFFVNNRLVFSRNVPGNPSHTVAVGVTVLANNYPSEALCSYRDVSLKVAP